MQLPYAVKAPDQAILFSELKTGMQVVIMGINVTPTKKWTAAHTGTITTINTIDNQITFDLPEKMSDNTPMMQLPTIYFADIENSHDKKVYLLDPSRMPEFDKEQQSQWHSR